MKRKFIYQTLLSISAIVAMSSCDLEEEIFDSFTPETVIKSVNDMETALYGAYASQNHIVGFGRNILWLAYGYDDAIFSLANGTPGQLTRKVTLNSAFGPIDGVWDRHYVAIANANGVLDYLNLVELDEDYELKAESEAKFIIGFWYFNLVQMFGEAPLVTESLDASDFDSFYRPKASMDELYDFIFQNFQEATAGLPDGLEMTADENGRASKQAAQGYLAKAYLVYANYLDLNGRGGESAQYYQLAENYADSVINSGQYSLIEDYAVLWDVNSESAHNQEVLYKVVNTRDETNPNNDGEGFFLSRLTTPGTMADVSGAANGRGNAIYRIQPWFVEQYFNGDYFESGEIDYRVEESFILEWNRFNNDRLITCYPQPVTDLANSESYLRKYIDAGGLGNFNHENDFFLLRYSEVLLIKAEAENELNGPTADAANAFNQLRARARLAGGENRTSPADLDVTGMSREEFRMAVFMERGLEFVGEYNRFLDLRRMRYMDNTRTMFEYQYDEFLPSLTPGLPSWNGAEWTGGTVEESSVPPYDPRHLLFPIPAEEVLKNPNLEQNTGW